MKSAHHHIRRAVARGVRRPASPHRRPARVALLAVLALTLTAGAAQAIRIVAADIVITGDGGFTPTALPRDHDAPITIHGGGRISTISGAFPPIIKTITIDYDKHGSVQTEGLAVCHTSQLTNTTVAAARRACPDAIVGKGSGSGVVVFPDQKPIHASSPITVFNGPKLHGQDTVIGHAYTTIPGPTTFIVPVVIQHIHEGRYGYRTTIHIPEIAGGYGIPLAGHIKVGRRWTFKGVHHSFLNARCPDGHLQARGKFDFNDGTKLSGTFTKSCQILPG
jgi:hypothetical protein